MEMHYWIEFTVAFHGLGMYSGVTSALDADMLKQLHNDSLYIRRLITHLNASVYFLLFRIVNPNCLTIQPSIRSRNNH